MSQAQQPASNHYNYKIDRQVEAALEARSKGVYQLLSQHRGKLEKLAEELEKHETLTGAQIREIIS